MKLPEGGGLIAIKKRIKNMSKTTPHPAQFHQEHAMDIKTPGLVPDFFRDIKAETSRSRCANSSHHPTIGHITFPTDMATCK